MLIKQGLQQQNKKCTRLSDCSCLMCRKEIEIMEKLTFRQGLEWFGRRKSLSQKNQSLKEVQLELLKLAKISMQKRKNKKNESETFGRIKHHLDCNSSYITNYNKKQPQNTTICHPSDHISLTQDNGNTFKTIYHDSFYLKNLRVQKEKPIKKLQIPMDLPFVGKSSYKEEFSAVSLTERSTLQRPKDTIKMGNNSNKIQFRHEQNQNAHTKVSEIFRPPSPIKNNGHMIKSNSYTFAYNTLYKNTFQKEKGVEVLISEPNPEFLRRSKFGSLSKTRWMTKQKIDDLKKESTLQMYI